MRVSPLVLLCLLPLLRAGDVPVQRKVACLEGFRPLKLHADGHWKVLHINWHLSSAPRSCSDDDVSKICRQAFSDVAYGAQGDTIPIHYSKVHRTPARVRPTTRWKNGTLEFREFLCQEYVKAQELTSTNGSWWDRIVATKHSSCLPEDDWLRMVVEKCGEYPTEHHFGGSCGKPGLHLEVVFVCNRTLEDTKRSFLTIMEDVLADYSSKVATLLKDDIYRLTLQKKQENHYSLLKRRGEAAKRIGMVTALDEEFDHKQFWSDEDSFFFSSKMTTELTAKHRLLQRGFRRVSMIFRIVADLIYRKEVDEKFIKMFTGLFAEPFIHDFVAGDELSGAFPELKQELHDYWSKEVYAKNTPLLSDQPPNVDLLQMYGRIVRGE
uniref:PRKCSH_1 domain-containing protein n=1 Tax=Steinernema glaseri TaxID=37863 RepID=A0A1I7ZUJ4_9BILA